MVDTPKLDPSVEAALRTLHDITTPAPVSWLPQTWGWAALAIAFGLALLIWLIRALRRYRRNAYRREALRLLDVAAEDIRNSPISEAGLQEVAELLKRTALSAWPREKVASLSGPDFARFLTQSAPNMDEQALATLLDDLEYRASDPVTPRPDDREIIETARDWIENHHVRA